jgi:hypothetical protein
MAGITGAIDATRGGNAIAGAAPESIASRAARRAGVYLAVAARLLATMERSIKSKKKAIARSKRGRATEKSIERNGISTPSEESVGGTASIVVASDVSGSMVVGSREEKIGSMEDVNNGVRVVGSILLNMLLKDVGVSKEGMREDNVVIVGVISVGSVDSIEDNVKSMVEEGIDRDDNVDRPPRMVVSSGTPTVTIESVRSRVGVPRETKVLVKSVG